MMERVTLEYKNKTHNLLRRNRYNDTLDENDKFVSIQNKPEKIKGLTYVRTEKLPVLSSGNPFCLPERLRTFNLKRNAKTKKSKPEPFIMSDLKTIRDTDKTFFKMVEGRPLRQRDDFKLYLSKIRDITLSRANGSYLKELIIQIDTSLFDELCGYKKIYKQYDKTKSNFVDFLKEENNITDRLQEVAEGKSQDLKNIIKQLNALNFSYVKIRNEVDEQIVIFGILSKYGHFLNSVSPSWWCEMYDKGLGENELLFGKMLADTGPATDSLVNLFKSNDTLFKNITPNLYFKNPQQLTQILDNISEQCLNYIQIESYFANISKSVLNTRDQIKIALSSEINEAKDLTAFCERQVKCMEEKVMLYKNKFSRILYTEFKKLFCSFESTHLHTCTQYVHTQLLGGPEDHKDNIVTLATNIENLYFNLTAKLDCFPSDIVTKVTREIFANDIKNMNKAHKAFRNLREYSNLKKSLIISFEQPRRKQNYY